MNQVASSGLVELFQQYPEHLESVSQMLAHFDTTQNVNNKYGITVHDSCIFVIPHDQGSMFDAHLVIHGVSGEIVIDTLGIFGSPTSVADIFKKASEEQRLKYDS